MLQTLAKTSEGLPVFGPGALLVRARCALRIAPTLRATRLEPATTLRAD